MEGEYRGWRYFSRVDVQDDRPVSYTIAFVRRVNDDDWYEELCYDSHDREGDGLIFAPHFYMKIQSSFKMEEEAAIEEIREIADNWVKLIREVTGK